MWPILSKYLEGNGSGDLEKKMANAKYSGEPRGFILCEWKKESDNAIHSHCAIDEKGK